MSANKGLCLGYDIRHVTRGQFFLSINSVQKLHLVFLLMERILQDNQQCMPCSVILFGHNLLKKGLCHFFKGSCLVLDPVFFFFLMGRKGHALVMNW